MNAENLHRQLAEARTALRDTQRVTQDMLRAWATLGGPLLRAGLVDDGATPHDVAGAVAALVDERRANNTLIDTLNQTVGGLENERTALIADRDRLRGILASCPQCAQHVPGEARHE